MTSITRKNALRLFGSAAVLAGLGLAGCQQEAQPAADAAQQDAPAETPENSAPSLDDFSLSAVDFDIDSSTNMLHATTTLTSNASVPCLLKADSLASYKAVDEYGDEQTEQRPSHGPASSLSSSRHENPSRSVQPSYREGGACGRSSRKVTKP